MDSEQSKMSSLADSIAISKYHRDMIEMHGPESSYALGWKDVKSQQVRFKALSGIADLNGRSVLDAGCGYGDLLTYLAGIYGEIQYTGIEQIPALLEEAIKRNKHLPKADFIPGDFTSLDLPAADFVFASGSLNYRSSDPDFIFKTITRLYDACKLGFAFNLLSKIAPNGLIVAYDPEVISAFCLSFCPNVRTVRSYDPDDFTVYMFKSVKI